MNIGIDGAHGGNGDSYHERYIRSVVEALATDYADSRLFIYTPKLTKRNRMPLIEELHNAEYRLPAPSGFQGALWRYFGITNCLQSDKIELYHGLNGILPLNIAYAHVPTVVTVHDPAAEVGRRRCSWLSRTMAFHVVGASVKSATRVIVFSEETRRQLMERYDIEPDKIDLLSPGGRLADQLMEVYHKALSEHIHLP